MRPPITAAEMGARVTELYDQEVARHPAGIRFEDVCELLLPQVKAMLLEGDRYVAEQIAQLDSMLGGKE